MFQDLFRCFFNVYKMFFQCFRRCHVDVIKTFLRFKMPRSKRGVVVSSNTASRIILLLSVVLNDYSDSLFPTPTFSITQGFFFLIDTT